MSEKAGTPLTPRPAASRPTGPSPTGPPSTGPVIPTSILQPNEQRLLLASAFGLVEVIKVWDILSPYLIPNPTPTWSTSLRVRSFTTATGWATFEILAFATIAVLRIPGLSPSGPRLLQLAILVILWNTACWFVAEPGSFWIQLNLFGPPALGVQWYFAWWPIIKGMIIKSDQHISGIHHIRLLPYSTATLNPLSLSYCIPPDSPSPVYIPIIFNNSLPNEVSYIIRSFDTGHSETKTLFSSAMQKPNLHNRLSITNESEDDEMDVETQIDPMSALILKNEDLTRLPSIKPADSLIVIPKKLATSENMLFIEMDRPGMIQLKTVSDKKGDRFHISPHREAVVIECPVGGEAQVEKASKGKTDGEGLSLTRCIGDEEVVNFKVRGVGSLTVAWKKRTAQSHGHNQDEHGIIEGVEDTSVNASDGELGYTKPDKVARTHIVPLRIKHNQPGRSIYSLTSITDSMNNIYHPHSSPDTQYQFSIYSRPTTKFDCSSPIQLIQGKTASLPFSIDTKGPLADDVKVTYGYVHSDGSNGTNTITVHKKQETLMVNESGTYSLLNVGGHCEGTVLEPSSCKVVLVPPPTLEMSVTTLHECAMDVGVTAAFDFVGTPPFILEYTERRNGGRPVQRRERFERLHGEISLLPDQEGEYTYMFETVSDKHYSREKLNLAPFKQTIHPLANVDLISPRQKQLYSCSGNSISIDLDAKGRSPLSLNYLKSWSGRTENISVEIPAGKSQVEIQVPDELSDSSGNSGSFSVSLVSISDGHGCTRRLPAPTVEVKVDRQKSTVRFAKSGKETVVEGETVRTPLRLTGNGPWEVFYARDGGETKRAVMRDANGALSLNEAGITRLMRVNDAHCSGTILEADSIFEVLFKPRPMVSIVPSSSLKLAGNAFNHKGLCADQEDQVAFKFIGEAPFELVYRHTREGHTSRHTLKSAQNTGILHLDTEAGKHRYDFTEIKDSNYASTPVSLVLENEIFSRPSISFTKTNSQPICLDSSLKGDAKVRLHGKAPFKVELSVRRPASSIIKTYDLGIDNNEWNLDLPYIAKEVGRYEIQIIGLKDSSGCDWIVNDHDTLYTVIEVVESARIVPVTTERDLCVGDSLDFLLQGKAPWTVEYEWLGKKHKVTSSASRFSRYAEEKGTFSITSVALKDNQCKREITDLVRNINPLPLVKIDDGIANLREGDEPAAFSVHFTGTPPFSFTYTRSETKIGGKSKIVETQTITDIQDDTYTITSSLPGDYQVISISDKYCRYPRLKGRRDS